MIAGIIVGVVWIGINILWREICWCLNIPRFERCLAEHNKMRSN